MRFIIKPKTKKVAKKEKPKPQLGDKKEKIKFALFPTKVEGVWVWLEKYIAIYEYQTYSYKKDVVVSSGIFIESYYTDVDFDNDWCRIDRKLKK